MSIEQDIERMENAVKNEIRRIGPSDAARLAGCNRSYLCRLSLGRIGASPKKLIELARQLGIENESRSTENGVMK